MKTTTLKKKLITIIAISLFGLYLTASISTTATNAISTTENPSSIEICSDRDKDIKSMTL